MSIELNFLFKNGTNFKLDIRVLTWVILVLLIIC
ncbi:MAG: hypothetical protein ACJAYY_003131 [Paraglaciecola sp.]|jgi:hypothetical protein